MQSRKTESDMIFRQQSRGHSSTTGSILSRPYLTQLVQFYFPDEFVSAYHGLFTRLRRLISDDIAQGHYTNWGDHFPGNGTTRRHFVMQTEKATKFFNKIRLTGSAENVYVTSPLNFQAK